jgi:hypothetical protein
MKTLIGEAPPKSIRTAASIAGRLILTAQSSSSSTATVGTGNSTRPSDIGFCNTSLTISNRKTRGAIIDHAASDYAFRSRQENELFAIDWLKKGILVERETSTLPSAAEAVAAAKMRARDVARRHPGQEPDTFRLVDATGKIVGVFPKQPINQK